MVTSAFKAGQKWISNAEPELGMGRILRLEHRQVAVFFDLVAEQRIYSRDQAPLTRVRFNPGDKVATQDGVVLTIVSISERDGIFIYHGDYHGTNTAVVETELDPNVRFSKPEERLFTHQLDDNPWFNLRYQTLTQIARLATAQSRGAYGPRVSLIPHQLYIANEVASRFAPRVLLADEVGLGKTIEAGMIIHQQLQTGRARRVLIVVPPALTFQWFVEMIRRFNLQFTVLDEDRCQQIVADNLPEFEEDDHELSNPFEAQQLVLCSLDLFINHSDRLHEAADSGWDLVVVDEAHHLKWTPNNVSQEYLAVEHLSQASTGLLLLTATPEQLGRSGHFARLRLLDPHRYHNFERFIAEESKFETLASQVKDLLEGDETACASARKSINQILDTQAGSGHPGNTGNQFPDSIPDSQEVPGANHSDSDSFGRDSFGHPGNAVSDSGSDSGSPEIRRDEDAELIEALLDRHGTGRVLFRNVRNSVEGFPIRLVNPIPLPRPAAFEGLSGYYPEAEMANWTSFDSRVSWLTDTLTTSEQKYLVICALQSTAVTLEQHLRTQTIIRSTVFHEGMDLIARDRSANYFAETYKGAQVMVCSEIGSEGRNFQFASHLVLFDLPLGPDLLEQRIGRLDRIGQTHDVTIHIPFHSGSSTESLYRWYHQGLSLFTEPNPVAQGIFDELFDEFSNTNDIDEFISKSASINQKRRAILNRGRDRLLEINSHKSALSAKIVSDVEAHQGGGSLEAYMEQSFLLFGLESESLGNGVHSVKPTETMIRNTSVSLETLDHFHYPELPEDGISITYDRDTALSREDVGFFTWENPIVQQALDLVATDVTGNSVMVAVKHPALKSGTLLLEVLHVVSCLAPAEIMVDRYLPPWVVRTVISPEFIDLSDSFPYEPFEDPLEVPSATLQQILVSQEKGLRGMLARATEYAIAKLPEIKNNAMQKMNLRLNAEIVRLKELRKVNLNVRTEELEFMILRKQLLAEAVEQAEMRLDAVRVIVAA